MTVFTRRDMGALSGAGLVAAMLPHRLFANTYPATDGPDPNASLRLVDPQLRAPFLLHTSSVDAASLAQMRASMIKGTSPALAEPKVVSHVIQGPRGAPDVRILVIDARPEGSSSVTAPRSALLYLHGGGYVAGTAAGELAMAQKIALEHDCVIVSVDYRLAPEVRFPGSLEDNYAALKWLHGNADDLGVDPGRIALMGTSAGGGHAAMLAIAARDRGEISILFQLLLSPMLDDRTGSTRKVPPHIGTFMWTAASNRFGWSSLLGVPAGSKDIPYGAVPSRLTDLSGLPPTYIGVGSIDLFVDENIDYAQRLVDAGVSVELNVVPGAYHVFFAAVPKADVSQRFCASFSQALARAFQASPR